MKPVAMKPKRTLKNKSVIRRATSLAVPGNPGMLAEVRELILAARQQVGQVVNAGLTMLYWQIGMRVRKDILREKRAEYGKEIAQTLSAQLTAEFGRGFGVRKLARMVTFAEAFPDRKIVSALPTQLGWSHSVELLPLKDDHQRDFYRVMCRIERWSGRFKNPGLDE
jgi:hypothetical protein